ncbi:MAG: peptidylprolyl isomerase [Chloroflexota bacterium]|nr:peptidylprolyl isomerase [Anaerolineae bacterium]
MKKKHSSQRMTKKQLSRKERESRVRLWLLLGSSLVFLLVVGVLAFGAYQEYVVKPASPVATVNDVVVRIDDYQRRVLYRRFDLRALLANLDAQMRQFDPSEESQQWLYDYFQQQRQQVEARLMSISTLTLDEMIEEELVRQEAIRRGLTVTDEEVQLEIESQFGYDRDPPIPTTTPITVTVPVTVTPAPTVALMTEAEFQESYANYVGNVEEQTTFREEDFRELMRSGLLRQKLSDALGQEVETSGEQVQARHILLGADDKALAEEILERLRAGEDFAELASEYSTDESNKDEGGDLGWFSRGSMVEPFEDAAFALQPGEISDVVETSYGHHIIMLIDRDDDRPFDEDVVEQKRASALQILLNEQMNSPAVERY